MLVLPSDIPRDTQTQSLELGRNYAASNPDQYQLIDVQHQNIATFNAGEDPVRSGWLKGKLEGGYLPELAHGKTTIEELKLRANFFRATVGTAIEILEEGSPIKVNLHFLHIARAVDPENGDWHHHAVAITTNPKAFYHVSNAKKSTDRCARVLPIRQTIDGISVGIMPLMPDDLLVFSSLSESLRERRNDLADIQGDNSAQDIADTMAKLTDPPSQPSNGHITLGIRIL